MSTPKKKSKTVIVEKMTVPEFKTWIKGLCAFQDDNWLPNKNQWEHIRQLIDSLDETKVQQMNTFTPGQNGQNTSVSLPSNPSQGEAVGQVGAPINQPAQDPFRTLAAINAGATTRSPTGEQLLPPITNSGQSEFI
jgi:hypothetical protein